MEILFLMDPLQRVSPQKDTTYALMRAAQARGHSLFFAEAKDLAQLGGTPWIKSRQVAVPGDDGAPFSWSSEESFREVESFPIAWIRTDPPFDVAYLEATWILERVNRDKTLLLNDPVGIRAANEKLYALRFPEVCPTTLVTWDATLLRRFVEEHGEVVIKPLAGYAGKGILFAQRGMRGLNSLLETALASGRVEAQVYLPEAERGDKRIILLDGEPLGAVLRLHGPGEERNNLHLGGSPHATALDDDDRRIIERVAPQLREDGLYFVGLDVIGGKLTEVNVTSPTGIQEIEALDGPGATERVIRWMEDRAAERAA